MTRDEVLSFLRGIKYAAQASVAPSGAPQAAVVGVAVSDHFEVVFDTLDTTRKLQNLRRDDRIALVFWQGERTVQLEGVADEPTGSELAALQQVYFAQFSDAPTRMAWPGISYVRVRPTWIRYSDFGQSPPEVVEIDPQTF